MPFLLLPSPLPFLDPLLCPLPSPGSPSFSPPSIPFPIINGHTLILEYDMRIILRNIKLFLLRILFIGCSHLMAYATSFYMRLVERYQQISPLVRRKKRVSRFLSSMTANIVEHGKKTLVYKAKVHPITKSSFAPTHTSYYQSLVKKMHQFFFHSTI